jgi:predicted ABC-type transport system involved in lysophospholipase L1 biosynthesis ATPase subunit
MASAARYLMAVARMRELLSLVGVSKVYRRGDRPIRVLVDVGLTVSSGEIVAVVGSRHEGKTTLLKIAAGLEEPDAGKVMFSDLDLARCSDEQHSRLRGSEIAWIHREGTGLGFDVLDYIAIPLKMGRGLARREAESRALGALERVGARECAWLSWGDLSNWERVLVAFARGMAHEPRLMIVDDVIDGFGMGRTREAGELLLSFAQDQGCGVLMSASDREAALVAERVWQFDRGRLELVFDESRGDADVIDLHPGVREGRGSRGAGA